MTISRLICHVLCVAPLLTYCKQSNSASQSLFGKAAPKDNSLHFSLAKYASETASLAALKPYVGADQTYLGIGDQNKFQLQSNLTVDVDDDLTKTKGNVEFWLDGYIFNHQIAGKGGHGQAVDMLASTSLNPFAASGTVRFLGKDILKSSFSTPWDKTFTRDLGTSIPYGTPMLGIALAVSIGGEVNVRGALGQQDDFTSRLSFVPSSALFASVSGKVKALNFASADVIGRINMIDTQFAANTTLGYHPDLKLVTASIGVDSGNVQALDGKLSVGANVNASASSLLPAEVDAKLWEPVIATALGTSSVEWQWEHVIWEPKAIFAKPIPAFVATGQAFIAKPKTAEDCDNRVVTFKKTVDSLSTSIEDEVAKLQGDDKAKVRPDVAVQIRSLATVKTNYQTILADTQALCLSL